MISVIVIGRNEAERLPACFESIQKGCRFLPHEIIYVDSHSSDDSLLIARQHGCRCFEVSDPRPTPGLGRQIGTDKARGEWLLFLDGDMTLQPDFLVHALAHANSLPCDALTGIREDVYLHDGREVSRNPNYFDCHHVRPAPEFGGALFIRSDSLKAAGGWAKDAIACEEAELHARLQKAGIVVYEIPVPMIINTDAVRDNRSILSLLFSRRRLGEGQAFRCALAAHAATAYLRRERIKFLFYALDWIALLLLLLLFSTMGIPLFFLAECLQLGYFLSTKHPRAFVTQKIFFFAFLPGCLSYEERSGDAVTVSDSVYPES